MYEYGYNIAIKGRTHSVVLGTIAGDEYEAKKREIGHANRIEIERSDRRGAPSNTTWFIRPAAPAPEAGHE